NSTCNGTAVTAGTSCESTPSSIYSGGYDFLNHQVNPVTPSIGTTPSSGGVVGIGISDTATVSGGFNPTGRVTFKVYGINDGSCTGAAVFTSANIPLSGGKATSATYSTSAVGMYHWIATYNGDTNNNSVSGNCTDEPVTTTAAAISLGTTPSAGGVW